MGGMRLCLGAGRGGCKSGWVWKMMRGGSWRVKGEIFIDPFGAESHAHAQIHRERSLHWPGDSRTHFQPLPSGFIQEHLFYFPKFCWASHTFCWEWAPPSEFRPLPGGSRSFRPAYCCLGTPDFGRARAFQTGTQRLRALIRHHRALCLHMNRCGRALECRSGRPAEDSQVGHLIDLEGESFGPRASAYRYDVAGGMQDQCHLFVVGGLAWWSRVVPTVESRILGR
jgi:hypothetical protein